VYSTSASLLVFTIIMGAISILLFKRE